MSGTAGGTNILREFLLKLGYSVDEGSQRKFVDAVKTMTTTVAGLGAAVAAAVAGLVAGVAHMAESMESLYYVSQRTKSSVGNIEAFKFAFSQLGGTASQAQGLLEKFSAFLRETPGHIAWVEQFTGTKVTDAVQGLNALGVSFQHMLDTGTSYSVVKGVAEQMGISEADLQVLLRNTQAASAEYTKMADKIIGNQDRAAENAVRFMQRYRSLLSEIGDFATRFGNDLTVGLTGSLEKFRQFLFEHADEINKVIDKTSDGIIKAGQILIQFGLDVARTIKDVIDWFNNLSPAMQHTIEVIGALGAAWILFNAIISASPIGLVLALVAAIVELYADYRKYQEGAAHLIPWEKWEPEVNAALAGLKLIGDAFSWLVSLGGQLGQMWDDLGENLGRFGDRMRGIFEPIVATINKVNSWLHPFATLGQQESGKLAQQYGTFGPLEKGWSWLKNMFSGVAPEIADRSMSQEQKAFLKTLSAPESGGNYAIKQGGAKILDLSQFPSGVGPGGVSTASGRYQFTEATWREAAQANNLRDFSPASQDIAAWWLASREYKNKTGRDLQGDLAQGGHERAITASLGGRWPSLPGGKQSHITQEQWEAALQKNRENTSATAKAEPPTPTAPTVKANTFPANYGSLTDTRGPVGYDVTAATTVPPPMPANVYGGAGADQGNGTVINQTNNFNAPNVEDPQKAVASLTRQLERTNSDLVRNGVNNAQ